MGVFEDAFLGAPIGTALIESSSEQAHLYINCLYDVVLLFAQNRGKPDQKRDKRINEQTKQKQRTREEKMNNKRDITNMRKIPDDGVIMIQQ